MSVRALLPLLFGLVLTTACAHNKKKPDADRILEEGDWLVRVQEEEAWEVAKIVGPSTEVLKKVELLPSGRRLLAKPVRVRAAMPDDLVPGATIWWTTEAKDGDVERLRRADWKKSEVKRVIGTRVQVGNGEEADSVWHVLVPLVQDRKDESEPGDPKME
jgi:hypothetical protein